MAGKQWMKTRPGHVALAALAWTILGCVFALPDLSAGSRLAPRSASVLLRYGGPGVWSHLSFFGRTGGSPFPASSLPGEFWRISFRACW